jgi:hypothetical protein
VKETRTREPADVGTNGHVRGANQTMLPKGAGSVVMPDEFYRQFVARQDGRELMEKLSQIDRPRRHAPEEGASETPTWPKNKPS